MGNTAEIKPVLIGELLFTAGVLKRDDLSKALKISNAHNLPLGRVLILLRYLTEEELKAALKAQSLINDGLLAVAVGVKALNLAIEKDFQLEQALENLGWVPADAAESNKLGELLVDSGMLPGEALSEALALSNETRLPLGRVLLLTGTLADEALSSALNAQMLIRNGKITRAQAVEGLAAANRRFLRSKFDFVQHRGGRLPRYQVIRLGQLFVLAGVITESELMTALEKSIVNMELIGEAIVHAGFTSESILETAVQLQDMVLNGTLNPLEAAEALAKIKADNKMSIAEALAEIAMNEADRPGIIRIDQLMMLVGILHQNDLEKFGKELKSGSVAFGKALVEKGVIGTETYYQLLRCQSLLRRGFLEIEEALVALGFCRRNKLSFDDAMEWMRWTVPLGAGGKSRRTRGKADRG
jgi:hypothetical protein